MEEKTVVPQRPQKSPGFAGVLGIFPFGAGALYNGQYTKALLHLIIFAGLVHMQGRGGGQPFIGLLLAGFIVYQFFDNIQSARAINAGSAGQSPAAAVDQGLPELASSGSIFWGLVLIVLGVLLILANFEIILYETLFDFWPVAVIIIGLKLVIDSVARSKNGK
ncbi:MAG: hypothetical protein A2V76_03850 [Candidatus Aminicenantes bacterium RBG_16_63_14]|nr:MAG: hypothetical protein A2V76_03850 [Candidatus Aminicenantes bacterium RBG_16_63_14]OGD26664.1 MAG: hypothetical protein A2V57_07720 [Candidatus Aminicenantes bacterium RBG_19FT_COMBO_65_30]